MSKPVSCCCAISTITYIANKVLLIVMKICTSHNINYYFPSFFSVGTVMNSLRQQITSPRKSQLSPGYGRFSMSCLQESPRKYKSSRRKTTPRSRESESDSYGDGDDTSSIYDMMVNIERELDSDDETMDGYQGDSESDNQGTSLIR